MKSERLVLWLAALAVFLVVSPVTGLDGRVWQEIVFVYGGFAAVAWALSGGGALGVFSLWLLVCAAWHPGPGAMNCAMMLLAFLGIFCLAAKCGAALLLRTIVALNLAVMAIQVLGLWEPTLRLVFPAARVTVYNTLHPLVGLTSSTGDLACILAMALPFCFVGRWIFLGGAGIFALFSTSALSGIVAGVAGLLILAWPPLRRQASLGVIVTGGVFVGSSFSAAGWSEISTAWNDERWSVWGSALELWFREAPITGHGLGSWAAKNFAIVDGNQVRIWDRLHFDLLQFGYETGIIGVLFALAAWAWAARSARCSGNRPALAGLAALSICQFGHFPFHLAGPAAVAALVVGEARRWPHITSKHHRASLAGALLPGCPRSSWLT